MTNPQYEVVHNPDEQRFEIALDGDFAVLTYRMRDNEILFTHTGTPRQYRGKGIAAQLVEAGLAYAAEHELTPVPLCSYVVHYMDTHASE